MPAITTADVVSHPAYNRYIRDTTLEEIDRMRIIVYAYDTFRRVNDRVTKFNLSERVPSTDGFDHYKECAWSDPLCRSGPDTCVCSYLSGELYYVIQSLNKLTSDEDCTTKA